MANLIVRWDESTGYGYLTTADGYPIPGAVWDAMSDKRGPFKAEAGKRRGELRIPGPRVREADAYLQAEGHHVTRLKGSREDLPTRPRARQECAVCAEDYPPNYRPAPGETCTSSRTVWRTGTDGTRRAELEHPTHPLSLRDCRAP